MTTLRDLAVKINFDVNAKPLEGLQKSLDKMQGRLTLLAGAQVLRGIQGMSERFGNFALDLQNTSAALGITTDEFQKLSYAAEASGVSSESLAGTLKSLNQQLYEARLGNEGVGIAFAQAGIRPEQLASFTSGEEALFALGKSLNAIQDPVLRAAAAQKTLGEAGMRLLPAMNKAQGGFRSLMGEADNATAVLGPDRLEALAETERSLKKIGATLFGLTASFASQLAPSVQAAAKALSRLVIENKNLINTTFEKWTYNIGYAMGFAYGVISDVFDLFKVFMQEFPNATKRIEQFLLAFLAFKAAMAVVGIPLGKFLGLLRTVVALFTTIGSMGGTVLNLFVASVGLGRGAIVKLLLQLAILTETAFPALSAAILSAGMALEATPIGWIATAVAAIVIASHDLWAVWNGAKFEDTWLGTAYTALKDMVVWLGKVTYLTKGLSWVGGKVAPALEAMGGTAGGVGAGGNTALAQQALGIMPHGYEPPGAVLQAALDNAAQPVSQRQGFGAFAAANPGVPSGSAPNVANNYQLSAPITINAPMGADPTAIGKSVKEALDEHMNTMMSRTQAALSPYAVR